MSEEDWKSPAFRENIASKLHFWSPYKGPEQISWAKALENHLFRRARSSEEYLKLFSRVLDHYKVLAGRSEGALPNTQGMETDLLAALENMNIEEQSNPNPHMF
ncbi:mediator of RNA polymerase II transcription subunit 15-like [Drosophila bipectinata]|uniref:mediator of RNA polymerase II transcription subunit 15-like n=1 Tax=Drosophila bipectinata TaxID=42026 RepID=UPI001C8AE3E6|nr:mediator of RNA polymerase II transcription subunit 15-like [Drosophila bipectinata]